MGLILDGLMHFVVGVFRHIHQVDMSRGNIIDEPARRLVLLPRNQNQWRSENVPMNLHATLLHGINNVGVALQAMNLSDDIELHKAIKLLLGILNRIKLILVSSPDLTDMAEPVIDETETLWLHGSLDSTTAIVATDNDVLNL